MPAVAASERLTPPRARGTRRTTTGIAPEKREHPKLIRFTATELTRVIERARLSGRPVACYIRESSLGRAPSVRRTEFSDGVIRALTRLATSLPQLARHAREQQLPGARDFEAAVGDVLALVRELD